MNRRSFLQTLGSVGTGGMAGCASHQPPSKPMQRPLAPAVIPSGGPWTHVVDSSDNVTPALARLKDMGVRTIFRYYARARQPEVPDKILGPTEARGILQAGFSLAVVYQYYASNYANFNAAQGQRDAEFAVGYAANRINQPRGSAIFFGVDGSWRQSEMGPIMAHFKSIVKVCRAYGYKVGVYGSGLTCDMLQKAGLVSYTWLPKSRGWWGSIDYFNQRKWSLFQSVHEYPVPGTGVKVDLNVLASGGGDFGQWSLNGIGLGHPKADNQMMMASQRFIRANAFTIYKRKSTAAADIKARFDPSLARTVRLLGVDGQWAYVWFGDQYGDGSSGFRQATGYCLLSTLTTDYTRMP